MRIGIDSGGAFTDFVLLTGAGRLSSFKLRSNPSAPHRVILEGIHPAATLLRADVVHGSTVLVPDNWKVRLAEAGNLILTHY